MGTAVQHGLTFTVDRGPDGLGWCFSRDFQGEGVDSLNAHETKQLTEEQLAMLALERAWWRHAGSKEAAILSRFGIGPTTYYQRLNALLDDPRAMAADPITVNRLRRLQEKNMKSRSRRSVDPTRSPA